MSLLGVFDWSAGEQFAAFALLMLVGWAIGEAFLRFPGWRRGNVGRLLPVAPFFVAVTTMFALFLGFLAADIWDLRQQAGEAAHQERSALARFASIAGPQGLDAPEAIAALERYREAVIADEWGSGRNQAAHPAADAALRDMYVAVTALARAEVAQVAVTQLYGALDTIAGARDVRLTIGNRHRGSEAWFTVVVLYLLSYVSIAAVHVDRPAAGTVALGIFGVAAMLTLWFLGLNDSAYGGGLRLESDMLRLALPALG